MERASGKRSALGRAQGTRPPGGGAAPGGNAAQLSLSPLLAQAVNRAIGNRAAARLLAGSGIPAGGVAKSRTLSRFLEKKEDPAKPGKAKKFKNPRLDATRLEKLKIGPESDAGKAIAALTAALDALEVKERELQDQAATRLAAINAKTTAKERSAEVDQFLRPLVALTGAVHKAARRAQERLIPTQLPSGAGEQTALEQNEPLVTNADIEDLGTEIERVAGAAATQMAKLRSGEATEIIFGANAVKPPASALADLEGKTSPAGRPLTKQDLEREAIAPQALRQAVFEAHEAETGGLDRLASLILALLHTHDHIELADLPRTPAKPAELVNEEAVKAFDEMTKTDASLATFDKQRQALTSAFGLITTYAKVKQAKGPAVKTQIDETKEAKEAREAREEAEQRLANAKAPLLGVLAKEDGKPPAQSLAGLKTAFSAADTRLQRVRLVYRNLNLIGNEVKFDEREYEDKSGKMKTKRVASDVSNDLTDWFLDEDQTRALKSLKPNVPAEANLRIEAVRARSLAGHAVNLKDKISDEGIQKARDFLKGPVTVGPSESSFRTVGVALHGTRLIVAHNYVIRQFVGKDELIAQSDPVASTFRDVETELLREIAYQKEAWIEEQRRQHLPPAAEQLEARSSAPAAAAASPSEAKPAAAAAQLPEPEIPDRLRRIFDINRVDFIQVPIGVEPNAWSEQHAEMQILRLLRSEGIRLSDIRLGVSKEVCRKCAARLHQYGLTEGQRRSTKFANVSSWADPRDVKDPAIRKVGVGSLL
jgi:hypothetical protein